MKIKTYFAIFLGFTLTLLSAKPYCGGELRTLESFRYGRFEVRMKSAPGSGVVSSFFTYHDYTSGGAENWNEIDIEFLGQYNDDIQFNAITPGQNHHVYHQPLNYNPHEEFHIYAFEWTPDYVAWFVDGVEVYQQSGNHIAELDKYQKIMMNIWPPIYEDWVGPFDPNILSVYAIYDWVKYYAYVPGSGNTGTGNNFIQLWEDPFDGWNTARWGKATHTFDGNNADFIHQNVVFQYGYMILCLTTPNNTGYTGPPLNIIDTGFSPEKFNLSPPYPNPFNNEITIPLTIQKAINVDFSIYNIKGEKVITLVNGEISPEIHSLSWDGKNMGHQHVPSGIYLARMETTEFSKSQKLILLK
ncbi:MAG: family 16 glycosylhydrolase [Candidatus Marinimicrobia bacterium]|nr:family 16 glycosylhydrolase [Candidatus Neomarinimicrobiota bacterium]